MTKGCCEAHIYIRHPSLNLRQTFFFKESLSLTLFELYNNDIINFYFFV